jgi:hypothetical protein
MQQYVYVQPREGLLIREDFGSQLIPPTGMLVRRSRHIQRRIDEGDLLVADQPTEPTPASSEGE